MSTTDRMGEIIETMSTGFVAESFALNRPPPLGSLVTVHIPAETAGTPSSVDLYAVVTYGRTLGLDPHRRAVDHWQQESDERALGACPAFVLAMGSPRHVARRRQRVDLVTDHAPSAVARRPEGSHQVQEVLLL